MFDVKYEKTPNIYDVISLASANKIHLMMGYKEYLGVFDAIKGGINNLSSVFVFGAGTVEVQAGPAIKISDNHSDICNEFSGLSFEPAVENLRCFDKTEELIDIFISTREEYPIYVRNKVNNCELFMLSTEVQDINIKIKDRNDIASYSVGIVPVLMYLKYVIPLCFGEENKLACIIIDDPLLHSNYGYLNYRKIISLMEKYNFCTTIAFIPWNYNNTDKQTADLFLKNKDKLSICVHGCDHTREEYSSNDITHLNNITKIATFRMMEHEKKTGISFDKVMVFPQGCFSNQAMDSLKENGYWAAINTSPISINLKDDLELKDGLGLYISKYGGFPLFTRNTPDELFSISFNLFLNKPVFIVIHHDYLKDDYLGLINAVNKINSRVAGIQWDGAGNVVKKALKMDFKNDGYNNIDISIDGVVGNKKKTYIFLRRHATVFRDNYLSKNSSLMFTYNYLQKIFNW
jgi:predicted transport protein